MSLPQPTDLRCLACGGKAFSRIPPKQTRRRVVCTQQGCVFAGQGLDYLDYNVMSRLLDDRYKAGYEHALDDVSSTLNKLENGYGDRRSSGAHSA